MQGISKVDELSNKITQSDEQESQNRSNRKFFFSSNFGESEVCGCAAGVRAVQHSQNRRNGRSYDETKIQKTSFNWELFQKKIRRN
ncbi:hypothetical protein HanXRQr2_Chr02g0066291 [Helianthus annuus]|uniref:Uncharacterized protein n=1 Tax=Helianthus annuus TaxID=4232 RepID=A0A9K3JP11_HELAN|nr:hypothetical protein HanXRQr2_Chr02g0066291 [Helianthus annuus]